MIFVYSDVVQSPFNLHIADDRLFMDEDVNIK